MMSCTIGNDGLQYTWLTYCNIQKAIMAFNTGAVLHSVSLHGPQNYLPKLFVTVFNSKVS